MPDLAVLGPSALAGESGIGDGERVEIDRNGLEVLDEEACFRLLERSTLGRVAVTVRALPSVVPVNFRLVDRTIVFRTGSGTKLDAAVANEVVAFEVDDIDPLSHTGWSVVVTGIARVISDPGELLGIDASAVPRWAPGGDDRVISIVPRLVSGRRLHQHAVPVIADTVMAE